MTDKRKRLTGHLLALLTIIIWGTTFVATKLLLTEYTALQIMLLRFFLAWATLFVLTGKMYKPRSLKEEASAFVLSALGVTLYFFFENSALSYTQASNVSILITTAPIFTAILAHLTTEDEKLTARTWIGFLIAFAGVVLVVFNGVVVLKLNPLGDCLSILAALSWACYSVLLKKRISRNDSLLLTRKMIFYAMLTTAVWVYVRGEMPSLEPLKSRSTLLSFLFLGCLAGSLCYVAWNTAISWIGAVSTNNYIYLEAFVTVLVSALVLKERITASGVVGVLLIVGGILVSEQREHSLFAPFYPAEYLDSTWSLDFEQLYRDGYRGILFDIDNTLVPHDAPATPESVQLFARLHAIGFQTCLISNNKEPRVTPFAEAMQTPYVYKAGKPKRSGYLEGMQRMGTDTSNTLFVGDQIFTDVWGANLAGIRSVLVKPISPKEEIQIVLKRYLEKIVLFFYRRKKDVS